MSTKLNLDNLNLSNSDQTNYFTNYYASLTPISEESYNAMVAEFESITGNSDAAGALASAVVYTCRQQGIDPMETLGELLKLEPGRINDYLAGFFNLNRVGTSRLGVMQQPPVNKYVKRSILP